MTAQHRHQLVAVLLVAAVQSRGCVATASSAPPPRPGTAQNVLLIISDDLRAEIDSLGFGCATANCSTPFLRQLSEEPGSVSFTRAYVQQALCAPTRNSFMTGRRPDATKSWNFVDSFREKGVGADWITLPQFFRVQSEPKYTVVGTGKVFHKGLPPNWDLNHSWDPRMSNGTWEDWMLLLQEYLVPADRTIYRVWFLDGKVQCGVKLIRPAPAPTTSTAVATAVDGATLGATVAGGAAADAAIAPTAADFTGGCVGGVCARPTKKAKTGAAATAVTAPASAPTAVAAAPTTSDFTGGCVSGVCALPPRKSKKRAAQGDDADAATATAAATTAIAAPVAAAAAAAAGPVFAAWKPSAAVCDEVERLSQACGADCDVGSIEFLRVEGEPAEDKTTASRVYFDVNLLSTLPLMNGSVQDKDGVWPASFDPWAQLADYLASKIQ